MRIKIYLFAAIAALAFAGIASAGTICPGGNSTNFVSDPDPAGTGCNTLITINANGSVTVAVPGPTPYDGVEDNLVGVLNNSNTVLTSLSLTGSNIFGVDGDGVCTFTFAAAHGVSGSSYCTTAQTGGSDPADYYGPASTFVFSNSNSGTVRFAPGVAANGGTAFFSLEEQPSVSLQVTVPGAPEPASYALFLGGVTALLLARHRRRAV